MIDIESKVIESLYADADRPIKVDRLYDSAVARAGAMRRRRHAFSAVAGLGLAVALTAGVIAVPRFMPAGGEPANLARPTAERPGETGDTPAWNAGPTTLPRADGVPPAAEQPATVGTDPGLLHFDVDLGALNATASEWTSTAGHEAVTILSRSGDRQVEVLIGPDAGDLDTAKGSPGLIMETDDGRRHYMHTAGPVQPTTVNGRPATLQKFVPKDLPGRASRNEFSWVLRWQPVDGLQALVQVFNVDHALAHAAADALRLHSAQRCSMPIRLTDVPAGVRLTECRTSVGRGVWAQFGVNLRYPDGHSMLVWVEDARYPTHPHDAGWFKPNRTVNGHPAMWMIKGDKGLAVENFGPIGFGIWPATSGDAAWLTEDKAMRLAAGLRAVGNPARPETWPQQVLG